jgi:hypothetical protein
MSAAPVITPAPEPILMSRVLRGAMVLDEHAPGWHQRIDLEKLDISSPFRCVLGQVFGHYIEGLVSLNMGASQPFGFAATAYDENPALTGLWRALISQRRERDAWAGIRRNDGVENPQDLYPGL